MKDALENLVLAAMIITSVVILFVAVVGVYAVVALSAVIVIETVTERIAQYRDVKRNGCK